MLSVHVAIKTIQYNHGHCNDEAQLDWVLRHIQLDFSLSDVLIHLPKIYICTYQYIKLDRCESVCPSVTDVMSLPQRVIWERGYNVYRNAYAGNESPNWAPTRHGKIYRGHSHSYRRATKVGQSTLEQAKTVLSTSRTLSQATKVRLRYKRVDFLGTANSNFQIMVDMLIFIAGR